MRFFLLLFQKDEEHSLSFFLFEISRNTNTEHGKTTSFKPAVVNGTHAIQAFTGQRILDGTNVTDNGKAFTTNGTDGVVYTTGKYIGLCLVMVVLLPLVLLEH
jgi:hypothetical protein